MLVSPFMQKCTVFATEVCFSQYTGGMITAKLANGLGASL